MGTINNERERESRQKEKEIDLKPVFVTFIKSNVQE